jgi:hypothetical protein
MTIGDEIADIRFRIRRRIRAAIRPTWAPRCRTSEDHRRRQRITFALWSRATSTFALRHSVLTQPSPKQQAAGSSPARGTEMHRRR